MVEYGIIFLLCIVIAWMYVKRDDNRWKKAVNMGKSAALSLKELRTANEAKDKQIKDLEERLSGITDSIVKNRNHLEQCMKEMSEKIEKVRCESDEISNLSEFLNKVLQEQQHLSSRQRKLAKSQEITARNMQYLKGRVENGTIEFVPASGTKH